MEFKKHQAIKRLDILGNKFKMYVDSSDKKVFDEVIKLSEKLDSTLTDCRTVVAERTDFSISQENVEIIPIRSDNKCKNMPAANYSGLYR